VKLNWAFRKEENLIDLNVLERVGLFRGLTDSQLTKISPLCGPARFHLDDRILAQDEKAEHLYFVIDGEVDIRFDFSYQDTSSKLTISTVTPGQSFGWSSLVEPYIYSRSVFCSTATVSAGKIEADKLRHLFSVDNGIGYVVMTNLARVIAKRHRALQDEVVDRGGWA
jgi:CRP-like cAMP-binding protein